MFSDNATMNNIPKSLQSYQNMLKMQHESVSREPDANPIVLSRPASTEASKASRGLKKSVIGSLKKLSSRVWLEQLPFSQPVPFNTDKRMRATSSKNNEILSETPKSSNNGRRKRTLTLREQYTNGSEDSNCKPLDLRKNNSVSSPADKAKPIEKSYVIQSDNKLTSVPCMDYPGPSECAPLIINKPSSNRRQNKRNVDIKLIATIPKVVVNKFNDEYLVDPCTGYREKRTDLNKNGTDKRKIIIIDGKDALNGEHKPIKEDLKNSQTTMQIIQSNEFKFQSSNNQIIEQNTGLKTSSYILPTTTALHPAPMSPFDGQLDFSFLYSLLSTELIQTATNSEQFEDAMEIIVEDGDYRERIEKQNKMKCIFCAWRGSRFIYEDHCRQDHNDLIETYETDVWTINFSLGTLFECLTWLYRIVEYKSALYIFKCKYQPEDDSVLAVIYGILHNGLIPFKSAQIRALETNVRWPYMWIGPVTEFINEIPDSININGFKNELSRIYLLPVTNDSLITSESVNILPEDCFDFISLDNYNVVLHVHLYNVII